MLIGELSKLAGCDAGTIRYYENAGILEKPYRSQSGYRVYAESHLAELNFVLHCRSLGMSLTEIKTLQEFRSNPDAPCGAINELVDKQIQRINEQVAALRLLGKQLSELRNCCNSNIRVGECGIMKALAYAAEGGEPRHR
jgi:Cd(II)/Pb(II)-responsive transcriptional regulator